MVYSLMDAIVDDNAKDVLNDYFCNCRSFDDEEVIFNSLGREGRKLKEEYLKYYFNVSDIVEAALEERSKLAFQNRVYKIAIETPYSAFRKLVNHHTHLCSAYGYLGDRMQYIADTCFKQWQKMRFGK